MPDGKIELKVKGRLEFISKFPLTSIQNLKVDDYCLGTSENSFCYWLEFKEILFGIGGGNASKFGIYKPNDGTHQQRSHADLSRPRRIGFGLVVLWLCYVIYSPSSARLAHGNRRGRLWRAAW